MKQKRVIPALITFAASVLAGQAVHPDLQGIWTNATLTPLQRPPELAGKEYFTPAEAVAYEKRRIEETNVDRPENRRAGDPGAYNQVYWERGTHVVQTRRTSLVIDPPDGKVPPMLPEAQAKFERARAENARHAADGPEDRNLSERCLLFSGVGPPMLPEPYNNNYEIVQGPDYVAIVAEMNHDVRVIPTGGRNFPRASPSGTAIRAAIGKARRS